MQLDIEKNFPHVVRLYYDNCDSMVFVGSGLLIGPRHVLTCAHVADRSENQEVWYAKDCHDKILKVIEFDFHRKSVRDQDPEKYVDLALLVLQSEVGNAHSSDSSMEPVTIVCGLADFLERISPLKLRAIGGPNLGSTQTGAITSIKRERDNTGFNIQVGGGIWEGNSGGPVIMASGKQWVCVGITSDGGSSKATSQIILGDTVYRFLCENQRKLHKDPGIQFIEFDSHTKAVDDAACEAALQDYSRKCLADWDLKKPPRFIEPHLAIRKDPTILDRSEKRDTNAGNSDESLLTDDEKLQVAEAMFVEQYRRLFKRGMKKDLAARICLTEDSGAGKSIFTRHLRMVLSTVAGQSALFGGKPVLAVRWEGREETWPLNLQKALVEEVQGVAVKHGIPADQLVAYALDHQRVCVILDALDQVNDGLTKNDDLIDRNILLDRIFRFLNGEAGKGCHVVITGRSYAITEQGEDGSRFPKETWTFATLEGFDQQQQERYLSDFLINRTLKDFIPSYREVKELLSVPVILNLIAEIAEADPRPKRQVCLDQFRTRSDVYLAAHKTLAERASKSPKIKNTNLTARARWEAILSAAAFAMMCDEHQRRSYTVSGEHAIVAHRTAAARWVRGFGGTEFTINDQDWDDLATFSQLTHHASLERFSDSTLGWKHRGWMEYFAGLYLARYASDEATEIIQSFVNDPDWYWVWRFAIEMPDAVADTTIRTATLAHLYCVPAQGRRPNELIYRAWKVMASSAGGPEVLSTFLNEYQMLLIAGNSLAKEIEASFCMCPPDPTRDSLAFLMGSPEPDMEARDNEKPQIPMTVKPFWMANTPVIKAQFWLYDPAHQQDSEIASNLKAGSPESNCPVIYVTWFDAWCFAKWCGARLPTEIEWEFACRAGTKMRYWWGDKMDKTKCTFSESHTTAAGTQHANPWGLMEMSGNVYEWCDTWYADEIATSADSDYVGDSRVLRGGSVDFLPRNLRSADRDFITPEDRADGVGFRISRTP